MMKRDGHTHTHFCRHGSGEETEEFILKAIKQGFTMYSLTEHLPLPEKLLREIPYSQEWKDSLRILDDDFDAYIREMEKLKKKYKDRIQILVGSEIDFLPDYMDHTRTMLKEYGPYLEDSLLSVHLIRGEGVWRAIDHTPEDFAEGLMKYYGSYDRIQLEYYHAIKEALNSDLGPYKPKRIGHLTLCNKFQGYFNPEKKVAEGVRKAIIDILDYMLRYNYSLDVNTAGLYKEFCGEIYPSPWIIDEAYKLGIQLVYGSDSHAVADVGRAYDIFEKIYKPYEVG
jgi:histidinol-phosphatase (PHP family)